MVGVFLIENSAEKCYFIIERKKENMVNNVKPLF